MGCSWAGRSTCAPAAHAPERYRAQTQRFMDAGAGPPAGAEPVDEPLIRRWQAAADGLKPAEYAALLAEDFTYRTPVAKRPLTRARSRARRAARRSTSRAGSAGR